MNHKSLSLPFYLDSTVFIAALKRAVKEASRNDFKNDAINAKLLVLAKTIAAADKQGKLK